MKNKLFFFSFLLLGSLVACSSNGSASKENASDNTQEITNDAGFVVEGKIQNYKGTSIKLVKFEKSGPKDIDSAKVGNKGTFSFKGTNSEFEFYMLKYDNGDAPLVLTNGSKVTVEIDAAHPESYVVKNDYENEQMAKLLALNNASSKKVKEFQEKNPMNQPRSQNEMKSLQAQFGELMKAHDADIQQFIHRPDTCMADFFALMFLTQRPDPSTVTFALDKLKPKYGNSHFYKEMEETNNRMNPKGVKIGDIAPDINLPGPDGKLYALSSLRGKVVLIDFWASWCRPCMQELPNVKAAYTKYKSKGFEIFGVSLDEKKDKWENAISSNQMDWIHVSDLKQWQSVVCPIYGVNSIPFTVLLDKSGKIIATNLRGEELDKKLAEVLGN